MKLIDLTEKKFGSLTVIKRSYPNSKSGQPRWLCQCSCGKEKVIDGGNLRSGNSRGCGCLHRLSPGLANMRERINCYKKNAERKGLEYSLTEEQFKEITQKDCHYCGAKPNNICNSKNSFGAYIYNGLDRIDNTKGYTIDNIVPCCIVCNNAKSKLTVQEFQDWNERVYNKFKGDIKMRTVILISCCSSKQKERSRAEDLYISSRFKYSLQCAKRLRPDKIFILSSKHGLVNLQDKLDPYNETLNNKSINEVIQWSNGVVKELSKVADLKNDMFIFLAGLRYRKYILPYIKNYRIPLKGMRIGQQLKFMKEHLIGSTIQEQTQRDRKVKSAQVL